MSVSNGIISEPVNQADVQSALNISSSVNTWSALCKHANNNKWTIFKPERIAQATRLTLAQRQTNHFGLTPQYNTEAEKVAYGYGGTDAKNIGDSGFTIADIIAGNTEWPYTKPTGGSYPYRITDYCADSAHTYGIQGYNHRARSPLSGWSDWELDKSELQTIISQNLYNTVYNRDTSAAEWKLDGVWGPYNKISGRLTPSSGSNMGSGGTDMIPLSWLMGGITTENWRIGVGVFVPNEPKLLIFVSDWAMRYLVNASTIMDQGKAFPSLGTNQYLCKKMLAALGSGTSVTFQAVPLLVKDCIMTQGQLDGGSQTLVSSWSTNTDIYSPASNAQTFNIILKSNVPYVEGIYTWPASATSDGKFIVGRYNTGGTAGTPPNVANVQGLAVFLCTGKSFTGTQTLAYNVTYTYGVGNNRQTASASGTVSITNSDTITDNGTTYVAKAIITPVPAVEVTSISALTYS